MLEVPDPTIKSLLESHTLRWIFVGGKGGVGKTTCSCCIATELARVRERVLIISTDPAHNLSDAFDQKFSRTPTKVKDFDNLFAMEIDSNLNFGELEDVVGSEEATLSADVRRSITSLMTSLPGIDEYISYTEVFRLVRNLDYSVVIFDTAPTGHTLRLLAFPEAMEQSLTKVVAMKNQVAPFLTQVMGFLGVNNFQTDDLTNALESRLPIVREITKQFRDPLQTTFVCVCIPEFLSMYETERLIQELTSQEINVQHVIVNQLLFPNLISNKAPDDGSVESGNMNSCNIHSSPQEPATDCHMCLARHKIQAKYLEQMLDLYEDLHVIQLPQLDKEVRGVKAVKEFARHLVKPYRR